MRTTCYPESSTIFHSHNPTKKAISSTFLTSTVRHRKAQQLSALESCQCQRQERNRLLGSECPTVARESLLVPEDTRSHPSAALGNRWAHKLTCLSGLHRPCTCIQQINAKLLTHTEHRRRAGAAQIKPKKGPSPKTPSSSSDVCCSLPRKCLLLAG